MYAALELIKVDQDVDVRVADGHDQWMIPCGRAALLYLSQTREDFLRATIVLDFVLEDIQNFAEPFSMLKSNATSWHSGFPHYKKLTLRIVLLIHELYISK